ncbi:putative ribonuclease H-like domain-containing protein [Tanacetum coccineum]
MTSHSPFLTYPMPSPSVPTFSFPSTTKLVFSASTSEPSLPEDHMADFHHLDDARDIWLAVKARFGGNEESNKMRKSMLKQEYYDFKMQAKPDNEDCNMKFLKALPASWSQTKGGLDYLSFYDLYNKLRTLKIDVKGGSTYDSRGTSAPTHSAFVSAASTNSKMRYPDQSHSTTFTTASLIPAASSNVIESVLHSFVAESDPQQQITYEDFDQIGKMDLEELDIKWQMAMLSVRINRFEKKAGRKMKFNNKDAARFDKGKVKCYKCSELGHFARECTGKQVDSKARYSSFKLQELNKGEETKALLSVDSMVNWSDHEGEDVEIGAAQVYGMIAGAEEDATGNATGDVADGVSNAAAEFALMGISSQVQTCPFGCEHLYAELKKEFDNVEVQYKECYIQVQAYKSTLQTLEQQKGWYQSNQLALEEKVRILTANLENTTNMLKYTEKLNEQAKLEKLDYKAKLEESKARFDKWKDSSKNLDKLIHSSMSSRSKFGLGFGETFGSDEVFDLSAPSIFDTTPEDVAEKPLYDMFVKAVGMHAVPPPITGTFMPPSNNPDIDDTQFTYGSKSTNYAETNSVSNDYVSCDNSDKSSDSETTGFASCVSSVKSSSSKTNEHLAFAPNSVAFQTMSETAVQQPSSTNDDSSFSFKENVKPPRNLCNKSGINSRSFCKRKSFGSKTCFVCGSKFHLIKDCDFYEKQLELHNKPLWNNVTHIPSFVPKAASVPAGSRNRPTSVPAGSRNRPTSVPTGRPFSAGWKNNAARPMTRPTSHYFQHFSRPGYYNQMNMDEGRWGTAENPHKNRDLGIVDSGCSRSMTGNKEKLDDFVKIVGGTVTFGGGDGKITGKGTIRTSKLNFENVYYVEELQNFNLFSVSQICDTKNKVLFTDKECLVLSKEFQLPENSQVVLRVPRRNNLYCFNLSDIKPERDVTCLLAKASLVESTKWHRRMAHVNFKNMNKLAKHGLVNGLPSKLFTNEHNCVACNKGKQHKATYKAITAVSTIFAPLQLLHMDLFGPTSIRSIDHKYYSLVVTDDFSRFTWVFFLGTKDETYGILKDFITFIENQLTKKVKAIRCDNGTEFKNSKLIELCGSKGIRRDYRDIGDFVKIGGGTVTFRGEDGKITEKGTIRTSKLKFENVYYVEKLQNLFNCFLCISNFVTPDNSPFSLDKKCLVLSKEFQPESSQVVLRIPEGHNLYCFNLSDIQPERDVTCLLAKASLEESTKWHRRMAHVNFKNMNKLAKHGLVNGLPSKLFTNEHNCVACNKGKQHKASYKAITAVSTISAPLQLLHMDLFGPTSIRSIDHKYYSLVVTDDFSRFTWVFFLGTKDETYGILKDFITFIENQLTKKVKAIRCDNGTEFKNFRLIELCGSKGIRRDYSNARTPQQNGVAERKNRTLIEAARTMLADSMLPTMFWTEAVSTACYVLNRVLVTKPHNKTPYELVSGKVPNISHLKPFGCLVTILNTSDHLGKFEGKADEGFIVGYAAYRVYNLSSKKIEEILNLRYLEDKPNVQGLGHEWYFDLDYLTDSLGYTRFKTNQPAGTQDTNIHAGTQADSDSECDEQVIVIPSNSFSGTKVNAASDMVESSSDYAEELARLQKQAYEANATAEKHLSQADLAASRNKVPAGKIDSAVGVSDGPTETSTLVFKPVHTDATSLPPGHSLGSSEHSTRYPSPSDLANSMSSSLEMEAPSLIC